MRQMSFTFTLVEDWYIVFLIFKVLKSHIFFFVSFFSDCTHPLFISSIKAPNTWFKIFWETKIAEFVNSVYPDTEAHNGLSNPHLHCLPSSLMQMLTLSPDF